MPFLKPQGQGLFNFAPLCFFHLKHRILCTKIAGRSENLDFWVGGWNFMSYLKPQVSFSLNFASLFNVMRENFFILNFIWFLQKVPIKVQNFRFDCLGEILPNLYPDRLLLLKVYKISAAKVQRSYVSWYWRVIQNLKKKLFVVSKMTRIWWILIWALKNLKNLHLYWSILWKVYNVWPKKEQRSYLWWHWRVMQNWRKTDLWFGKWHEEFD